MPRVPCVPCVPWARAIGGYTLESHWIHIAARDLLCSWFLSLSKRVVEPHSAKQEISLRGDFRGSFFPLLKRGKRKAGDHLGKARGQGRFRFLIVFDITFFSLVTSCFGRFVFFFSVCDLAAKVECGLLR